MAQASMLREQYVHRLKVIAEQANPQPAELSGATSCQRSGLCCWRRPCELHEGDPERIAAFLGITPQELFKEHLVVDSTHGQLLLVPRRGQQEGGRFLRALETYDVDTACHFLDTENHNACRIHEVKPTGGAIYHCAMSDKEKQALPRPGWSHEALEALGWDGEMDDEDGW